MERLFSCAFILGLVALTKSSPEDPTISDVIANVSEQIIGDIQTIGEHVKEDIQTILGHVKDDAVAAGRMDVANTIQTIGQHLAEDIQTISGHLQGDIEAVGAHVEEGIQLFNQSQTGAVDDTTTSKAEEETTPTTL